MALFTACELKVDLVFVSDVSLSIGSDTNYDVIKTFIINLISFLEINPNANLAAKILFARHADINFHLQEHTNANDLIAAVDRIVWSEIPELARTGTNFPEALDLLRNVSELRFRNDDDVTRIAVYLTDGRPNTKDLTGNTREQDAQNTEDAAARLHESGIYEQIYAIGIRGNRNINFRELQFIASDPSLVFIVDDFTPEAFEVIQTQLTQIVCTGKYIYFRAGQ